MSSCVEVESCCCTASRSLPRNEDVKRSYHAKSDFVEANIYDETLDQSEEELVGSVNDIYNLPHEVWTIILNYVPQKDRLQHRLVSKTWSNLIDECSTFKISYNSVPPMLMRHVLGLRIRGCEYSGIRDEIQPFSHPLLVREITLGACMSAENTKTILSNCKNVEFLRYFATEKSDTAFCSSIINHEDYLKDLKRLKLIEIGIMFFGRRNSSIPSSSIKTLIGNPNIVFNAITDLQIHFKLTRLEWNEVYGFVSRHAKTLSRFGLYRQCICEDEDGSDVDQSSVLESLKAFSKCTLKSLVVVRGVNYKCGCAGELLWSNVLRSQCKVECLNTDLVPTITVVEDFLVKNQNSLNSLRLHDVALGIDAHMDFSIFQNCKKLQCLSLSFLSSAVIIMKVFGSDNNEIDKCKPFHKRYSECSGLQFLPQSLKKLSIKGCDILSSTLLEMSCRLINLTELYLGERGGPPQRNEYGVSLSVLVSFIQNMLDLKYLTIHCNFLTFSAKQKATFVRLIKDLGIISESENVALFGSVNNNNNNNGSLISLDLSLFTGTRMELAERLNSELYP